MQSGGHKTKVSVPERVPYRQMGNGDPERVKEKRGRLLTFSSDDAATRVLVSVASLLILKVGEF